MAWPATAGAIEDAVTAFLDAVRLDGTIEQPYVFLGRILDHAGERLPRVIAVYAAWEKRDPGQLPAGLSSREGAGRFVGPGQPGDRSGAAAVDPIERRVLGVAPGAGHVLSPAGSWQEAARQLSRKHRVGSGQHRAHMGWHLCTSTREIWNSPGRERAEYERLNEAANGLGERR